MNTLKKIWHDENSEPPKNYLWAKEGKLFKNINGQWKEISKKDSGGNEESSEITLAQAWTRAFRLDKKPIYDYVNWSLTHSDEDVPLPDFVMCASASAIYDIDHDGSVGVFDITKTAEEVGITIPQGVKCTDDIVWELNESAAQGRVKIVPFNEVTESDYQGQDTHSGSVYFMYSIDKLSDEFSGSFINILDAGNFANYRIGSYTNIYIIKYRDEYYFINGYEGD